MSSYRDSKNTSHHHSSDPQGPWVEKEQEILTCIATTPETYLASSVLAPQEQKLRKKAHTNVFWGTQKAKYLRYCKASAFELVKYTNIFAQLVQIAYS